MSDRHKLTDSEHEKWRHTENGPESDAHEEQESESRATGHKRTDASHDGERELKIFVCVWWLVSSAPTVEAHLVDARLLHEAGAHERRQRRYARHDNESHNKER